MVYSGPNFLHSLLPPQVSSFFGEKRPLTIDMMRGPTKFRMLGHAIENCGSVEAAAVDIFISRV